MNRSLRSSVKWWSLLAVALALASPAPAGDENAAGVRPARVPSWRARASSTRATIPVPTPRIAAARLRELRARSLPAPARTKGAAAGKTLTLAAGVSRTGEATEWKRPGRLGPLGKRTPGKERRETLPVRLAGGPPRETPDGAGAGFPSPCAACARQPLACGTGADGTLAPDDCADETGAFADLWEIVLAEPHELQVLLSSTAFDPFVVLLDESCQILASNDDCEPGNLEQSCLATPLRPGRYFVLATSFATGSTGAYRVEVECGDVGSCTPCPVADLACDSTTPGRIERTDCDGGGGMFRDTYRIVLAEAGRIEIDLRSQEIDTVLEVLDAFCVPVGINDDCIPLDITRSCLTLDLAAGEYSINVSTFSPGEVGSYQISTVCRPGFDPCADCRTGEIACGVPLDGTFPAGRCTRAEGQGLDVYAFSLPQAGGVDVALTSASFDTYVTIFDATCAPIAENDDCGATLDSCLQVDLPAGDYFIGVSSFSSGEVGPFRLTVDCTDLSGCADCVAGTLACNGMVDGAFDAESCTVAGGRRDLWRLELAEPQNVRLELGASFSGRLALLDTRCRPLDLLEACDAGPGTACATASVLSPGSYLVEVATSDNVTGAYTLAARCEPFLPCRDCLVGTITCGDVISRAAGDEGTHCLLPGPAFVDVFSFTLDAPQEVQISMVSPDFDAVVVLLDGTCGAIDFNDDCPAGVPGGVPTDSCLTLNLPAGEHFIGCTVFDIGLGRYDLSVRCGGASGCADCVVGEIACGVSRSGELSQDDCAVDGAFLDLYELRVEETSAVSLELRSVAFDTFLVVLDEACQTLELNDDCEPGNLSLSCLAMNLEPGLYLAGVTSFGVGETGPYELAATSSVCPRAGLQIPGDLDLNTSLDAGDGMFLLEWLLAPNAPSLPCADAAGPRPATVALADFNGSGRVDVSDAVSIFYHLFQDGPPHALGSECTSLTECPDSGACGDGP